MSASSNISASASADRSTRRGSESFLGDLLRDFEERPGYREKYLKAARADSPEALAVAERDVELSLLVGREEPHEADLPTEAKP